MLIEARKIHKSYTQGHQSLHVVSNIDLAIASGEIVAIVGPSGAGKSTLLHILGGLDNPTGGQVFFKGKDLYALSDQDRARVRNTDMGFVFQAYHLVPELTALENVLLPRLVQNNSRKTGAIEAEGLKLLERLGLGPRATHRPSQLSGGEQQRVAIGRALFNGPEIIFCDEPTGNLDSKSGEMVMDILLGLNKDQGQSIVIVTHDERISRHAHRTIFIRDGKIEKNKDVIPAKAGI